MQIVIDIPEDLYEGIERRDGALETEYVCDELMKAVDNGTPLEQEPCEDCISRQAVIELAEWFDLNLQHFSVANLIDEVENMPTVNPQEPKTGRWIPVSERLPNDDEDVLVCYLQGGMEVCYYHIDDTFYPTEYANLNETGWFNENGDALYFEPIAWMPLPEPYKKEGD